MRCREPRAGWMMCRCILNCHIYRDFESEVCLDILYRLKSIVENKRVVLPIIDGIHLVTFFREILLQNSWFSEYCLNHLLY